MKLIKSYPWVEIAGVSLITGLVTYNNHFTRSSVAELLLALTSPCQKYSDNGSIAAVEKNLDNPFNTANSTSSSYLICSVLKIPMPSSVTPYENNLFSVFETSQRLCPNDFDKIPDIIYPLVYALFTKIVLTAITFGIKVPAGIYVPSMVIGALFGRVFGIVIQYFGHSCAGSMSNITNNVDIGGFSFKLFSSSVCGSMMRIVPGTYAMAGAGAFMGGVTRMNLTLAVILFELTGSLRYVLPFSISILVANLVANSIESRSLYEILIEKNDFPYLDNRVTLPFDSSLADIMPQVLPDHIIDISTGPYVTAGNLETILYRLHSRGEIDACIPIVKGNILFGIIPAPELEFALDKIRGESIGYYKNGLKRNSEVDGNNCNIDGAQVIEDEDLNEQSLKTFLSVLCKISVKDSDVSKYHHYYYSSNITQQKVIDEEEQNGSCCRGGGSDDHTSNQEYQEHSKKIFPGLNNYKSFNHVPILQDVEVPSKKNMTDRAKGKSLKQYYPRSSIVLGTSIQSFASQSYTGETDYDFCGNNSIENENRERSYGENCWYQSNNLQAYEESSNFAAARNDSDRNNRNVNNDNMSGCRNCESPTNLVSNDVLTSDITPYIDRAPIVMDIHSPLALVQMFFTKLGARAISVLEDGEFVGVLHKKKFIEFCRSVPL